jgi:predicted O-methyltransferase YrrM
MEPNHPNPNLRFEKDPRWAAVDEYALSHLYPPGSPYHLALQYAKHLSEEEGLSSIEVSAMQGRFLKLQCMLLGAKNILEVGTLGGYSSIILASGSEDAKVTTVEIQPKHKAIAE